MVAPTTLGILLSKIIERKYMDFTHAVVDDGDIIRKYRWSKREAKWYKDSHPDIDVIELPKAPKEVFNFNDYEEAPY